MQNSKVELWILSSTSMVGKVDLIENEPMPLVYSMADVTDITSRANNKSLEFVLPGTKNNNRLFDNIYKIGSASAFDPNQKAKICVMVDSQPVFNGIMQLGGVNIKRSSGSDVVMYNATLYSNFADLITNIGDNYINQLNWNDLNHFYLYSSVTQSWSAGTSNGYVYPMVDYGFDFDIGTTNINNPTNISPSNTFLGASVSQFFPAVYESEILNRTFQAAGYIANVTDGAFQTEFNRCVLPFNGSNQMLEPNSFVTGRTFQAQLVNDVTNLYFNYSSIPTFYQLPFSGIVFDMGGLYEPLTSTYSSDTYSSQAFTVGYYVQLTGDTSQAASVYVSTNLYINGYLIQNLKLNLSNTTNVQFVTGSFPFQTLRPNDQIHITTEQVIHFTHGYPPLYEVTYTILSGSYWYNTVSPQVLEGQYLDFSGFVPQNTKQIDNLTSLANMFNLWFETDSSIPNQINISPRDSYLAAGNIIDWSDKLDASSPVTETFLSEQQPHQLDFTYSSDDDWYNNNYYSIVKLNYGEARFTFDNQWTKDVQTITPIFSPTPVAPVINASNNFVIPKMLTLNTSTNPGTYGYTNTNLRICQYNYRQLEPIDYWTLEGKIQTGYPYCGMLDDPFTGTTDLSFSAVAWTYYQVESITQNNLLNTYYQGYLDQLSDPSSKMIEAQFYLTPLDINNLRFNNQIYVRGITDEAGYYYLINQITYDPVNNPTSDVQLIKIPYPFYKYKNQKTIISTNNNGGIGSMSTSINLGSNTVLGVSSASIGQKNIITSMASGSIATGYFNSAQGEVSAIFGINNSVADTNIGATIIGSGNTTDSFSINTFNIGSNNYLGQQSNGSGIIGSGNKIDSGTTNAFILGGIDCYIPSGLTGTMILGSSGLTATASGTTYVDKLVVKNSINGISISGITGGTAAGSDYNIQINSGGTFYADSGFSYVPSSNTVYIKGSIVDGSGSESIDPNERIIYGSNGDYSIMYDAFRLMWDSHSYQSLDWNNRLLIPYSGGFIGQDLSWANGQTPMVGNDIVPLSYLSGITTGGTGGSPGGSDYNIQINSGGTFYADSGFTYDPILSNIFVSGSVLDWNSYLTIDPNNRFLYDNSESNIYSVDYGNRYLYDPSGTIAKVDWGSGILTDSSGIPSLWWEARYLWDSGYVNALTWGNSTNPTQGTDIVPLGYLSQTYLYGVVTPVNLSVPDNFQDVFIDLIFAGSGSVTGVTFPSSSNIGAKVTIVSTATTQINITSYTPALFRTITVNTGHTNTFMQYIYTYNGWCRIQ